MKNILSLTSFGSLNADNTFLPNVSGDVHSVPLVAQDKGFNPNTTRAASKLIENYFSSKSTTTGRAPAAGIKKGAVVGAAKVLASNPVYSMSGDKVVINVFYYLPAIGGSAGPKNQSLSNSTVNSLGEVLSNLFKRPVELRLVRLHYPYLNSHILAQYIAINTRKYNFTRIQRAIFSAVQAVKADTIINDVSFFGKKRLQMLPAYITGMRIKISGRLVTQRSVPRQTVQTAQIGTFSTSLNAVSSSSSPTATTPAKPIGAVEYSSFTSKNKKGAFTVKVWISQVAYPNKSF